MHSHFSFLNGDLRAILAAQGMIDRRKPKITNLTRAVAGVFKDFLNKVNVTQADTRQSILDRYVSYEHSVRYEIMTHSLIMYSQKRRLSAKRNN